MNTDDLGVTWCTVESWKHTKRLVKNHQGKKLPHRPRRGWEGDIKSGVVVIGCA